MTSAGASVSSPARSSIVAVILLNIFFWSAVPVVTFLFLLIGIPYVSSFLLVTRSRRKTKWVIRRSISNYGTAVLRCAWPWVRVDYVDYSPDDAPPFVFVSNHRSSSDAFLMACLPYECIQVLNNWPSKLPVVGPVSKLAEYLQIRKMTSEAFMIAGMRLLAKGVSIITFPEGTRSGSRRLGPFHGSAFRLAQQAGANIVPLAISGNENIPKRGSIILHPGRIVVAKLPAVRPGQIQDLNAYKLKNLVRDRIRQHLDSQI